MRFGAALLLGLLAVPPALGEVRDRAPAEPVPRRFPPSCDFEENLGQADTAVRFLARGGGCLALLTDDGAHFVHGSSAVQMRLPGARPGPLLPEGRRPGLSHYLGASAVTGVPRHGAVRRPDVWPGVDLRWTGGRDGSLSYSFHLRPGADAGSIAISFGGRPIRVDRSGDLLVEVEGGVLRHGRPRAFQDGDEIPVAFLPRPDGTAGFVVEDRDPARPLVIDPRVVFSANAGGSAEEEAWAVAAAPDGSLFFAGFTQSPDFPVLSPFQAAYGGNFDAFVLKRAPGGASLLWSTYLGGSGSDVAFALAVDASGEPVVGGSTRSTTFPVTAGSLQPTQGTLDDTGFVTRMAADGASVVWSTFLGGSVRDAVRGLRLGAGGEVYVVGTTSSPDFPHPGATQPVLGGGSDAFVARIAPGGGSLDFATFLGGGENDEGRGIDVGPTGTIFVAGMTESIYFPDVNALATTLNGSRDAFAAAYAGDGSAVLWATYLGGGGVEEGTGVAVDPAGNPWVVGFTASANFPLQSAFDATYGGQFEGFATKFSADGTAALISTFVGGTGSDKVEGVAVDTTGSVCLVGRTSSLSLFPLKDPIQKGYVGGDFEAFVTVLAPSGTQLLWSTYRGGIGSDYAVGVALDRDHAVVLAGRFEGATGDAMVQSFIAVPLPPTGITGKLTGLNRVMIFWSDQGSAETGYRIERRLGDGPWTEIKTVGANARQFSDGLLAYGTAYSWRVISFNEYGTSGPSAEFTLTTLPFPVAIPAKPTNLRFTFVSTRSVNLAWNDNSDDEDTFAVERFDPNVGWFVLGIVDRNVATYRDGSVQPLRQVRYRVRAVNPLGSSLPTAEVATYLGGSFDLEVTAARRKDRAGIGKDSIVIAGVAAKGVDTHWGSFRPDEYSLDLWLGDEARPLLSLPENHALWKAKKGKWVLKYPYSPRGKATLVVDPATRSFKFTLTKAELDPFTGGEEKFRFLMGDDGAAFDVPWVAGKKAGDYRFP